MKQENQKHNKVIGVYLSIEENDKINQKAIELALSPATLCRSFIVQRLNQEASN